MMFLSKFFPIIAVSLAQSGKEYYGNYNNYASRSSSSAGINCPSGFELVGKKCEMVNYTQPQRVCVVGRLVGDICEELAPETSICPLGTKSVGNQCLAVHTTRVETFCPAGFTDSGNGRVKTNNLNVVDDCEVGALNYEGKCVYTENATQIVRSYCPAGFSDEGKGCMRLAEYAFSPAEYSAQGGSQHAERLLGKKKGNKKAYVPYYQPSPAVTYGQKPEASSVSNTGKNYPTPTPPTAPAMPRASEVHVSRQTCVRKDFANKVVEKQCPPGFQSAGDACLMKKEYAPVKRCANGKPINECFDSVTAPKEKRCANGKMVGDSCEDEIFVPKTVACPTGTVKYGNECVQKTAPRMVCPSGSVLEGSMCVTRNYADPTGEVTVTCVGKECFNDKK